MAEKSAKMEKFERLAERRVSDAVKKLRLIGNLANRNNYAYTDQHVKQILQMLNAEIRDLKRKYDGKGEKDDSVFQFKD